MKREIAEVQAYYDANALEEWDRLDRHPLEWVVTTHYLKQLIPEGSRVLDIGGGPGRYSLWLAARQCDVTLLDLSPENVALAQQKAKEQGLCIQAVAGDARRVEKAVEGSYDAVLLMGPLYHLLEEADRRRAVESALACLKPGGLLFAAFLNVNAAIWYALHREPQQILTLQEECRCFVEGKAFCGTAFTQAYTPPVGEIAPFMDSFGLKQRHLLGVESVCAMAEPQLMAQPKEVWERWMQVALAVCERTDLLPMASHLLYIGEK